MRGGKDNINLLRNAARGRADNYARYAHSTSGNKKSGDGPDPAKFLKNLAGIKALQVKGFSISSARLLPDFKKTWQASNLTATTLLRSHCQNASFFAQSLKIFPRMENI